MEKIQWSTPMTRFAFSPPLIHKKSVIDRSALQPIPIPSYLIAIAAGNILYRAFPKYEGKTWTTGVWAEPELIDAAYWEFSEDTARSAYLVAQLSMRNIELVLGSWRSLRTS